MANAVIARNRARKEKQLRTERPQGARVVVAALRDERAEASWTVRQVESHQDRYTLGEVGVLYRTNAQSRAYEDALRGAGIPYRVVGGIRFYERREVKDVLAYLRLLVNPADDTAFFRAIGWPRRGVGAVTLERMEAARSRSEGGLLDVAAAAREVEGLSGGAARALALFARDLSGLADLVPLIAGMVAFGADRGGVEEESAGSGLGLFLQHVSLLSDVDQYDPEEGAVSLMTLHNAKGMEFPVVFIGGAEEGLLPLGRSSETIEELEEERRLFYVGLTRAMDHLHVTHVSRRFRAGTSMPCFPSSFLDDLPEEAIDRRMSGAPGWRAGGGQFVARATSRESRSASALTVPSAPAAMRAAVRPALAPASGSN